MIKINSFRFILSDLDGVIRNYPIHLSADIESKFHLPNGSLLSTAFQKKFIDSVVTGKISDEIWREKIGQEISKLIAPDKAREAVMLWSEFPGNLDNEVMNFLILQKAYSKLALLTNATTKLNKDLKTLGILEHFDVIFNTSEIGFAKPDKRSFEYVIDKLQCKAAEVFFIDDRQENIEVAMSMGFLVHHFKSIEGLKEVL